MNKIIKPGAPRLVLVMLLGIAWLELGISGKFGQVWNLAFKGKTTTGS